MNVYTLGASKNIGYYSAIRLLGMTALVSHFVVLLIKSCPGKGATVTFLLRKPEVFDNDELIQPHVKSGKARLVKGDALSIEDVARGWAEAQSASESHRVDAVLFTVGERIDIRKHVLVLTVS